MQDKCINERTLAPKKKKKKPSIGVKPNEFKDVTKRIPEVESAKLQPER